MGLSLLLLPLLLPLLPLPASLQAGGSANCRSNLLYDIYQPKYLSAPEGGSIHIPFSFCYGWEPAEDPRVSVAWKWKEFHGPFISNTTVPFIPEDFKGRLFLNWKKDRREGSLQISDLRREDESVYFCRVQVTTLREGTKVWQSIPGTKLTVTRVTKKTTKGPTSTSTSTTGTTSTSTTSTSTTSTSSRTISTSTSTSTNTTSTTDGIKGKLPLSLEAIVGVALAGAVLIIAILGLIVYLRRKRSKCQQTKAGSPARGSFHNTEEKSEDIGNKGQHRNSNLDPKVDGIVYASLELSRSASPSAPPCHPPHETPQEEILYSVLKT